MICSKETFLQYLINISYCTNKHFFSQYCFWDSVGCQLGCISNYPFFSLCCLKLETCKLKVKKYFHSVFSGHILVRSTNKLEYEISWHGPVCSKYIFILIFTNAALFKCKIVTGWSRFISIPHISCSKMRHIYIYSTQLYSLQSTMYNYFVECIDSNVVFFG